MENFGGKDENSTMLEKQSISFDKLLWARVCIVFAAGVFMETCGIMNNISNLYYKL